MLIYETETFIYASIRRMFSITIFFCFHLISFSFKVEWELIILEPSENIQEYHLYFVIGKNW